ncbi:MAG: ParA family protein [Clostridia bacterium]|nr:ParA family protein [Clostridia bacterium]
MKNADIYIICGHYGCGKTNLAINLAIDHAKRGEKVTLCDLDIVNPYFRSSDYAELIRDSGIELIAPTFAQSNVDLPSIPAAMYSIFAREGTRILDVGGDDAGATALGRFSRGLCEREYAMYYVVNKFRALSTTEEEAAELLREIEQASRLTATGIVNNSHVMEYTKASDIIEAQKYAQNVATMTGLPLLFTAVEKRLADEVRDAIPNLYEVDIRVKKPWEA